MTNLIDRLRSPLRDHEGVGELKWLCEEAASEIARLSSHLQSAESDIIKGDKVILRMQAENARLREALESMIDNVSSLRFSSAYPYDMRTLADAVKIIETVAALKDIELASTGTAQSSDQASRHVVPPGHTDLMVTPESLDAWLEDNPLPAPPSPSRKEAE